MVNVIIFLMFLMTVSIPMIAIIAELSKNTPNTVFHSTVRSIICIGSLLFLSQLLQLSYKPCFSHFFSISFVFIVSVIQLIFELNQTDITKILHRDREDTHI